MRKKYNMPVSFLWYVKQTVFFFIAEFFPFFVCWILLMFLTDKVVPDEVIFGFCLACLACFGVRRLNHCIILDDDFIEVRYGIGYFRYRLKYRDIIAVDMYGSNSEEYKKYFGKITSNKYSENVVRVGMSNLRSIYVYVSDEETQQFYDDLKTRVEESKINHADNKCKVALPKADIIISAVIIAVSAVLTVLFFTRFQQYKIWSLPLFAVYSFLGVRLVFRNGRIKSDRIVQSLNLIGRNIYFKNVERYKRIGGEEGFVKYRLFMKNNGYRDVTMNTLNSESFMKKADKFNIKREI